MGLFFNQEPLANLSTTPLAESKQDCGVHVSFVTTFEGSNFILIRPKPSPASATETLILNVTTSPGDTFLKY